MSKYKMLVRVLDSLRMEAPSDNNVYHVGEDEEHKNQSRSLAYIHLFFKAYFNIPTFNERERYIVDGKYDGGIDAYYIDKVSKKIYFIQSKFRTSEKNFKGKSISVDELIKMEIDRISRGEIQDEKGNEYNEKIIAMQKKINDLEGLGRYKYVVIILANVSHLKSNAIDILIGSSHDEYEIIDYQKAYDKLLFPILKGTCHMAKEIVVNINVDSRNTASLEYNVETEGVQSSVQLFFVPTIEIAKVMSEYKNSILKYNPRSFLGKNKNQSPVNDKIRDSIINKKSNEFSLFNNGITMLSNETSLQTKTGKRGEARLEIKDPQIINGGQTANTLASIYEDQTIDNEVFNGKEVLMKIVTFNKEIEVEEVDEKTAAIQLSLIENLSRSTNLQSVVKEADRRSNDDIQISLQNYIFEKFGYCYERKAGEFYSGEEKGYITKNEIIPKNIIIRIANSIKGDPSSARRSSDDVLFKENSFNKVLNQETNLKQLLFGYFVYKHLIDLENSSKKSGDKYFTEKYGNGIRYGKYAIVNMVSKFYDDENKVEGLESIAKSKLDSVLTTWLDFEEKIVDNIDNEKYFKTTVENDVEKRLYNYDGYYKGTTINNDLKNYFENKE